MITTTNALRLSALSIVSGVFLATSACSSDAAVDTSDAGDAAALEDTSVTSGDTNGSDVATHDADASVVDSAPSDVSAETKSDAGTGFRHPGILVSQGQLDFVKAKIAAGASPWKDELAHAKTSKYARLPYVAHPVASIKCGNGSSSLDQGCSAAMDDAVAAYTQALIWAYTGDATYSRSAIAILDLYSSTLKEIVFDPAKVSSDPDQNNGPLVAAWLSESFPRSAEILRYSAAGWTEATRFGGMLKSVLLPRIIDGWFFQANWNLSMANGIIDIAVFTDDRALFQKGIDRWRERVPFDMYLETDGAVPLVPKTYDTAAKAAAFWYGQTSFAGRSGHTQETCRDFSHTQMGHASTIYAAETAGLQGVDLYGEQQARIVAAFEYIGKYLNEFPSPTPQKVTVDATMCGGSIETHDVPVWELAYNHYAVRKSVAMPETKKTRDRIRAMTGTYAHVSNLQMAWEELTHGDTGTAGFP